MADDALKVPFEFVGGDRAKLAIDEVMNSFSRLEREVLALNTADEKTGAGIASLIERFAAGKLGADELRASLAQIAATDAPKSAAELKKTADEARKLAEETRKLAEAEAAASREARTFGDVYAEASQALRGAASSTQGAAPQESALSRWASLSNVVTGAITTAQTAYNTFASVRDSVASLATEQERLDRNSARLGVDFNQASDAAGRFADETTSMTAATRLFESGTRLSQEQLNALMRVAGEFSQTTGVTVESAVDQLTQGLISGSERGLRPFGASMAAVAGDSHTMEERLAALVEHAGHVERATDSSSDSIERWKDSIGDGARSAASAFATELQRVTSEADAAEQAVTGIRTTTDDLTTTLSAVGSTAAYVWRLFAESANSALTQVITRAQDVAGAVSMMGRAIASPLQAREIAAQYARDNAGRAQEREAATARLNSVIDGQEGRTSADVGPGLAAVDSAAPPRSRADELEDPRAAAAGAVAAPTAARARGGRRGGGRQTDSAADEIRRAREQAQRQQQFIRGQGDGANFLGFGAAARDVAANDNATQDKADEAQGANSGDREERFGAYAGGRRAESAATREREQFATRYEQLRTFTEHWEELHHRQLSASRELAEGGSKSLEIFGQALSAHVTALVQGRESAGDAFKGFIADTLIGIGQEASIKGAMETAEGVAALAGVYTAALAPGHFGAAAAYFGVAAATGIAGTALKASGSAAGSGASAPASTEAARRPLGLGGSASNDNGRNVTNITVNLGGAGVILGSSRQLGEGLAARLNNPNSNFNLNGVRVRAA